MQKSNYFIKRVKKLIKNEDSYLNIVDIIKREFCNALLDYDRKRVLEIYYYYLENAKGKTIYFLFELLSPIINFLNLEEDIYSFNSQEREFILSLFNLSAKNLSNKKLTKLANLLLELKVI